MRVGVVGAGIAGLSCAYALNARHEVVLIEAADRLGGHAHTQIAHVNGREISIDTGFIVYNDRNYPDLIRLFDELGVATLASDMSFAASVDDGRLEYCGSSPTALFAQPSNLLKLAFWGMLRDILTFNRVGSLALANDDLADMALGQFLDLHRFGRYFRDCYLLPMGAAIWSMPVDDMLTFPATTFLRFFDNHGLLTVSGHPQWRTLRQRSADYVKRIAAQLKIAPMVGDGALLIKRHGEQIEVTFQSGRVEAFDQIVLAAHADQSLALLDEGFIKQRDYLACFRFQANDAVLHSDPALMPNRRRAWASWNYLTSRDAAGDRRVSLTYWMNKLQSIDEADPLFVTLNPIHQPAEQHVHHRMVYDHPVFDATAVAAQARLGEVQGQDRIWLAGAWLGYGFHEDGARSGLDVAAALGAPISWQAERQQPAWLSMPAKAA